MIVGLPSQQSSLSELSGTSTTSTLGVAEVEASLGVAGVVAEAEAGSGLAEVEAGLGVAEAEAGLGAAEAGLGAAEAEAGLGAATVDACLGARAPITSGHGRLPTLAPIAEGHGRLSTLVLGSSSGGDNTLCTKWATLDITSAALVLASSAALGFKASSRDAPLPLPFRTKWEGGEPDGCLGPLPTGVLSGELDDGMPLEVLLLKNGFPLLVDPSAFRVAWSYMCSSPSAERCTYPLGMAQNSLAALPSGRCA